MWNQLLRLSVILLAMGCCFTNLFAQESTFSFPQQDARPGFLFIDGECVPPPYKIESKGDELLICDRRFLATDFDFTDFQSSKSQRNGEKEVGVARLVIWFAKEIFRGALAIEQVASDVKSELDSSNIVVLTSEMPPVFLSISSEGRDLLAGLVSEMGVQSPTTMREDARQAWDNLVLNFQSTPEFESRAKARLAELEVVSGTNLSVSQATLFTDRIGYPLTMVAMILVVFAFGHLLSNKPNLHDAIDNTIEDAVVLAKTKSVVVRSLIIVGMLSLIDLIWTIVASQTGSMRELNPLGNEFIQNPILLIFFKVTVVGFAITVLYRLHERPIAQVASWWSCLVLTLLTARWLTFNSMFL